MRFTRFLCLFLPLTLLAQTKKRMPPDLECGPLCMELFTAIRANPAHLVMRLEEALVINESCAPELVTAAIDAVNADPAMMRKILETSMQVAPAKQAAVMAAVKNYSAPVPVAGQYAQEEIRRPELPAVARAAPLPGEIIRRAELPLESRSLPIVEVRRAEVPAQASPASHPMVSHPPPKSLKLMNVPKARAAR